MAVEARLQISELDPDNNERLVRASGLGAFAFVPMAVAVALSGVVFAEGDEGVGGALLVCPFADCAVGLVFAE